MMLLNSPRCQMMGCLRSGVATGAAVLLVFAVSSSALAQDLGSQWADEIVHRFEKSPSTASPLDVDVFIGERYTYDNNIFLDHTSATSDSIMTTFGRLQLDYADPDVDVESDLLVNYNEYLKNHRSSSDEERFYGRGRYAGSKATVELAEIFRHESTPLNVIFANQSKRIVSDTLPRVAVEWDQASTIEAMADIQSTQFEQREFRGTDNTQSRVTLMATRELEGGITVLLDGGYQDIRYSSVSATPSASGYFGRAGVHGDLSPTFTYDVRAGVTSVKSQDLPGTNQKLEHSTMDAEMHLRYESNDRLYFYGDYTRRITFAIGEPFQTVDLGSASVEYTVVPEVKLIGRIQIDRSHGATGILRSYRQGSLGASYTLVATAILDVGLTYRQGHINDLGGLGDFKDTLASIGVAITF
jgi:hypothetical protein